MRGKRFVAAALTAATLAGLLGCAPVEEAVDSNLGTQIDPQQIDNSQSIHLRDKDLLYSQYDNTEIVTMYLTVSSGSESEGTNHTWEEVNTYSAYDYDRWGVDRYKVAGLLQVGDENGLIPGELGFGQVAPNCTVQIRGQTSSKNAQKNYKISIKDNKGSWRGQTTIALNKHQTEGLRFRNKMAFDLMAGMDEIMSLRTTFVRLYVKDTTAGKDAKFQDYGIYTQVEQLNKTALKAHGLDNRGHLYKINLCEFFPYEDVIMLKDDPRYDEKKFGEILEIKGDDDHTKLIALLKDINDYTIPIDQILAEHFDVENITYWLAFNMLMGNMDTQNRNFYIYSPQNEERWYILPWDLDGMLRRTEYELADRIDYQEWESGVSNYWGNVLFQRCLKSENFRKALDEAVTEMKYRLRPEVIDTYIETYSKLLKPLVYSGRDRLHAPLTPSEYDYVAKNINNEIADNYRRYQESLTKPMPFYIGVPQKTKSGYTVEWDGAYDFDGENITYTFELDNTYTFDSPIVKQTGLEIPMATFDTLPAGQYFIRVTCQNESGQTQVAFDCYHVSKGKIYGTKCFYVDKKGNIVEDVYVEG